MFLKIFQYSDLRYGLIRIWNLMQVLQKVRHILTHNILVSLAHRLTEPMYINPDLTLIPIILYQKLRENTYHGTTAYYNIHQGSNLHLSGRIR